MTSDPVLQGIALRNRELHDRVINVLLELSLASSTPGRAPKPGPSRDLGVSLAWYSGLSGPDILRLTGSSDPRVRRVLASREKCPSEALMLLASDPDEWVRYGVFTNAATTDEVRAAVTLNSSGADIARWVEQREDPPTGPEDRTFTEEEINDLTGMPADWNPLRVTPSWSACKDRMAVWSAGRASLWPSTAAFLQPTAPKWILQALSEYGHPAALVDSLMPEPRNEVAIDPSQALKELVDSGLLIRALWRELAIWGSLELTFTLDYLGWPHLIPHAKGRALLPLGSAAEYVISGGEESFMEFRHVDEWVVVSDSVSLPSARDILGEVFDYWMDFGLDDEIFVSAFDDPDVFRGAALTSHMDTLDRFALAGLAHIQRGHGIDIATEAATDAMRALDVFPVLSEARDLSGYEFEGTIGATVLPWISYSESGSRKMKLLAELLLEGGSDLARSTWGVQRHFLECMALHPSTPGEIRVLCTVVD